MKSKFYMVVMLIFATTMAFSQVSFDECDSPENIEVTNISYSTALLNWLPAPETSVWYVEVGPVGFNPGQGDYLIKEEVILSLPAISSFCTLNLKGLEPMTQYEVYIRTVCEYEVEWVGPVTFMTRPKVKKSESVR